MPRNKVQTHQEICAKLLLLCALYNHGTGHAVIFTERDQEQLNPFTSVINLQ